MTITAPTYSTLNVEASGSQAVVTASIPTTTSSGTIRGGGKIAHG